MARSKASKATFRFDQVVAEVKRRIDVFAPGGGFVLSSCNSMIDVKPENILAMFETAREYGKYR